MRGWTPEQWLTVISGALAALGACISSIVAAIQTARHEQAAEARHAALMAEVKGAKPQ